MVDFNKLRIEKRGKSIAAMGLVSRDGASFKVQTPSLRGHQTNQTVSRNEDKKVVCTCLEFLDQIKNDPAFRCEHIYAVKAHLNQEKPEEIITIADEIKEIKRELALRRSVYPKWNNGTMSETQARQIAVLESVLLRLERFQADEERGLF